MSISDEFFQKARANKADAERALSLAKYYSNIGKCDKFNEQMGKFKKYNQLAEEYEALAKIQKQKEDDDRKSN